MFPIYHWPEAASHNLLEPSSCEHNQFKCVPVNAKVLQSITGPTQAVLCWNFRVVSINQSKCMRSACQAERHINQIKQDVQLVCVQPMLQLLGGQNLCCPKFFCLQSITNCSLREHWVQNLRRPSGDVHIFCMWNAFRFSGLFILLQTRRTLPCANTCTKRKGHVLNKAYRVGGECVICEISKASSRNAMIDRAQPKLTGKKVIRVQCRVVAVCVLVCVKTSIWNPRSLARSLACPSHRSERAEERADRGVTSARSHGRSLSRWRTNFEEGGGKRGGSKCARERADCSFACLGGRRGVERASERRVIRRVGPEGWEVQNFALFLPATIFILPSLGGLLVEMLRGSRPNSTQSVRSLAGGPILKREGERGEGASVRASERTVRSLAWEGGGEWSERASEGWGARRLGVRRVGGPKFRAFPSRHNFHSSLSWGSSRGNVARFKAEFHTKCAFGFLCGPKHTLCVEFGLNRAHNSTRGPPEREERLKIVAGEGKRAQFWAVWRRRGPAEGRSGERPVRQKMEK